MVWGVLGLIPASSQRWAGAWTEPLLPHPGAASLQPCGTQRPLRRGAAANAASVRQRLWSLCLGSLSVTPDIASPSSVGSPALGVEGGKRPQGAGSPPGGVGGMCVGCPYLFPSRMHSRSPMLWDALLPRGWSGVVSTPHASVLSDCSTTSPCDSCNNQ